MFWNLDYQLVEVSFHLLRHNSEFNEFNLKNISAMMNYEKQSSMVRLANVEFEKDPRHPKDLLKVLVQGMALLQDSKSSLDLEPISSPMARYAQVINEDIKELSDYIEMVQGLSPISRLQINFRSTSQGSTKPRST